MAELKKLPSKSSEYVLSFYDGFRFGLGFMIAAIVVSLLPFIACAFLALATGFLEALSR